MTTQTRRLLDYTLAEIGDMTNQEVLTVLENELQYPDEMTEAEYKAIKDDIKAIKDGTYRNPCKKAEPNAWGKYLVLGALYVGVMNLGLAHFVPTIPILSDLTPIVGVAVDPFTNETSSDHRIMSHREFNRHNPRFCEKPWLNKACIFEYEY